MTNKFFSMTDIRVSVTKIFFNLKQTSGYQWGGKRREGHVMGMGLRGTNCYV